MKTTKLTGKRIGAAAFRGTYSKVKVNVPKGKATTYKKLLRTKGLNKKAIVK